MNNCLGCIFLKKSSSFSADVPFSHAERDEIKSKNKIPNSIKGPNLHYSILCHRGVWKDEFHDEESLLNAIININRADKDNPCFYYPYRPEMNFDGAINLQEQEMKNKILKKQFKFSTIGLWIAGISLLLNFVLGLIRLVEGK